MPRSSKEASRLSMGGPAAVFGPVATAMCFGLSFSQATYARRRAILKWCLLSSILLAASGGAGATKNTVLHCRGYQVGDRHPVTDQIITLDMQNNVAVSIQLGASNSKDVINAPFKISKDELQ